jgi:hypothetical protein
MFIPNDESPSGTGFYHLNLYKTYSQLEFQENDWIFDVEMFTGPISMYYKSKHI